MASFSEVPADPEPAPRVVKAKSAPPTMASQARGFVRFLYCSNPFYVISAALILWGLYQSFDAAEGVVESLTLMSSLWGYTLVLAAAAVFLIRWGRVWDDVRTILLMMVLMFLAGTVTFDRTVMTNYPLGRAYAFVGLGLAMLLSEVVLGGTRLRLPLLFRGPYYLLLSLFFLYPLVLAPYAWTTKHPASAWLLLAFPSLAAAAFLLLLPAVRKGSEYTRHNGSPWQWPLYPWTLFGVLAFGVGARTYMLCVTFHPILGESTIFAPYFLTPFLLVLCVLALEMGRREGKAWLSELAVAASIVVVVLSLVGLQSDGPQGRFAAEFVTRVSCTPFYAALLLALAFYAFMMLRRFGGGVFMTTACLAIMIVWGPTTRTIEDLDRLWAWPLLAIGGLHLILGWRRRSAARGFAASCCLLGGGLMTVLPSPHVLLYAAAAMHLLLGSMLLFGFAYDDPFARFLRRTAAYAMLPLGAAGALLPLRLVEPPEDLLLFWQPVALCCLALALFLRRLDPVYLRVGWLLLAAWMASRGSPVYEQTRYGVAGMDWIAGGAACFVVAFCISLRKANLVPQWLIRLTWGKISRVSDDSN